MKPSQHMSPESGFSRVRMATGVLAALGIAGTIGGSVLAYSDTTATTTANTSVTSDVATVPDTSASTGTTGTATDPTAATAPTAAAVAPGVTSGSGQSQATSGGS